MNALKYIICIVSLIYSTISIGQISNNMTLLDTWDPGDLPSTSGVIYNDLWGYVDENGREYAILGSASGIHFIDVSDPQNVVEVDRILPGELTIWRDFKTFGNRAYAVSDNTGEGLIVMDLSTLPDSVSVINQTTQFFTQCHNIFIDEDNERLYVAGGNTQTDGLIVLDLSQNPDQPELLSSQSLVGGYAHDLYVRDNIVYGSHGFNGVFIWDYTDINNIELLASIPTNGYNHSSWASEDCRYLFYAEEIPAGVDIGVIDLKNLRNGEIEVAHTFKFPLLAPTHTNVTPHNPYVRDTMLVVSYYEDGTQVFNIGDPLNPQPFAHYDTHSNDSYRGTGGNWGTYPFLPSGNIISSDIRNGLFVMKMNDYDPSTINFQPSPPTISLSQSGTLEACDNEIAELSVSGSFEHYTWYKDNQKLEPTDSRISITESGTYRAEAFYGQCSILSDPVNYTIHITTKPSIAVLGSELEAMPASGTYTWHTGNTTISGNSGNIIEPEINGTYWVEHIDENGCSTRSDSIFFFVPKEYNNPNLEGFDVKYFASANELMINLLTIADQTMNLNLYNVMGQAIYQSRQDIVGLKTMIIETRELSSGIYFLTVDNGKFQDAAKIYIH